MSPTGHKGKTHLVKRGMDVAACGLRDPSWHTTLPARVTCGLCVRTVQMADAELAEAARRSRRAQ